MVDWRDKRGFAEGVQSSFALDDAVAFRQMMLGLYQERCAVTGRDARTGLDESLDVFLFQPLDHGGRLTPNNAIVVEPAVASLMGKGLILIGDDYTAFAPHPEVIGQEPDAEGSRGRRLWLPDSVSHWPDRTLIAYHRSLFLAQ